MRPIALFVLILIPVFAQAEDRPLSRIGFGSRVHQDKPPLIRLQIRGEDGQIAFQHKVPLSALIPREDKVEKPAGPGAISTEDAKKKVGEQVTVEMTAQSVGSSGKRIFLNSEKNYRDEKNFTILLDMEKAGEKFKEAKIDDPKTHFKEKRVRVTGTVSKYREQVEIIVTDPTQIKIVEK
jgi:hypothetical protein